jgi:hypothetical protein
LLYQAATGHPEFSPHRAALRRLVAHGFRLRDGQPGNSEPAVLPLLNVPSPQKNAFAPSSLPSFSLAFIRLPSI